MQTDRQTCNIYRKEMQTNSSVNDKEIGERETETTAIGHTAIEP